MSEYKPPFYTTDRITNPVAEISEQIGRITVLSHGNSGRKADSEFV